MNTLDIAFSLKNKYLPNNADFSLAKKRQSFLSECIIPSDISVYSGQGATLQTNNGELIDFSSMTVNCILGQNDPWVNANLMAYVLSGRPSFLTTRFGSEFYYKVAKRIGGVTQIKKPIINHRQCNGTDVSELAVLAAYQHRKPHQRLLVSFKNSYHGQGLTAYIMSGKQRHHQFLVEDAPVVFLDSPDNTHDVDHAELTAHEQGTLQELQDMSDEVFAVIIEPIQVNNGVNTPSKKFLQKLRAICRKADIALIFDEAQTGFGWLGTMTAAERFAVIPDLIALSKAVTAGNGPMGVLVSREQYRDVKDGSGAKTNGADIRSLVASNAVMDRLLGMKEQDIPDNIPEQLKRELSMGLIKTINNKVQLLMNYLEEIQRMSAGLIYQINGDGLIRGLEIVDKDGKPDFKTTIQLQEALMYNGVFVRYSNNSLIVKPPLVTTEIEFEKGFKAFSRTINKFIS